MTSFIPNQKDGPCLFCGYLSPGKPEELLRCEICYRPAHLTCLGSDKPNGTILADNFYTLMCRTCLGSEENLNLTNRAKMSTLQILLLVLYNLHMTNAQGSRSGFFHWKIHIYNFLNHNWKEIYGPESRKKKKKMVSASLCGQLTHYSQFFLTGHEVLKDGGWYRLKQIKSPAVLLATIPVGKKALAQSAARQIKGEPITQQDEADEPMQNLQEEEEESGSWFLKREILKPEIRPPLELFDSGGEDEEPKETYKKKICIKNEIDIKEEEMYEEMIDVGGVDERNSEIMQPSLQPTLTLSSLRPTLKMPSLQPTSKQQSVRPTLKIPSLQPTSKQPSVRPTLKIPSLRPTLKMPSSLPTSKQPLPQPTSKQPSPQPTVNQSSFQQTLDRVDVFSKPSLFTKTPVSELGDVNESAQHKTHKNLCRMNPYEERQLLKSLENRSLPPHLHRLRRKLAVRKQKMEHGLPLWNFDDEVKFLVEHGRVRTRRERQHIHTVQHTSTETRVLDRFQVCSSDVTYKRQDENSSFLMRLGGHAEDDITFIYSPYTLRTLKPFIMRDYSCEPIKLRLLREVQKYPHRTNPKWIPPPQYSIDYCYVTPQHVPAINQLARKFFWPGIDLSEVLQYPDHTCVVLYRKLVVGFGVLVPDTGFNEAYVSYLLVHPEWRRAGMATFILYHLIQTCAGKDVTLHVSATNPALILYQRFGFKVEEFLSDFYDKYLPADSPECKHAMYLRLSR